MIQYKRMLGRSRAGCRPAPRAARPYRTIDTCGALLMVVALVTTGASARAADRPAAPSQPVLGHRVAPLLRVHGLMFKDLDGNGKLDPYEDWRLSPQVRARDLVRRLQVGELAGLLLHGNMPGAGPPGPNSTGEYDFAKTASIISESHVNSFSTRYSPEPRLLAAAHNRLQEVAERTPFGIPLTISSDPRNHIESSALTTVQSGAFSKWPEPPGLAAIGDPALVRRFADIVRQEYLAVGIREGLSPQADLATDPRWTRLNGTFGEDAEVAKQMVRAYVEGMQYGGTGLNPASVATIVKHWVGYGAQEEGLDSHNSYGRFAVFPGGNFQYHIIPFTGAFEAHAAGIMPTYSILRGVTIDGKALEPVGAGYNRQLLTGLLRGRYGFDGVIVSDWSITKDCGPRCQNGTPAGEQPTFADLGMPWGVENLTREQRFAKAINAGVDQIGGTEETEIMVAAVKDGLITRERLRQSAYRVLLQKFQMGLFENPYVDEDKADSIVGNPDFVAQAEEAQSRSLVLLENQKHLLPLAAHGSKVYLSGLDRAVAESFGLVPVDSPQQADFAIIRAVTPSEVLHPSYALGHLQHEGRLDFRAGDAGYDALVLASQSVPTVFVVEMNRPAILTNVQGKATALVASFGATDKALLNVLTGRIPPKAHLPYELPSSMQEVQEQKEDLPHDSAHPLYAYGYGLSY
jgi:beta-glucosidase